MRKATLLLVASVLAAGAPVRAERFDIRDFGATPNDTTDDTVAIRKALQACRQAGGGEVFVPAGVYLVSRQGKESPILPLPSNTTLRGQGAASVLKFDSRVNQSNFWRMLGAGLQGCRNVVVCNLRLDGSNTFLSYEPGKTPEHNHGIFLRSTEGVVENVTIRDCLIENFSGDCIGIGKGCRNVTVLNVTLRNFVRQGVQIGGGQGDGNHLVAGCQDLPGKVRAGGSTIHVEHARGLKNVLIINNRCRRSILAGEADGLVIRGNVIDGRLEGNYVKNAVVADNLVRGPNRKTAILQFGFAGGLLIRDNLILGTGKESTGIYVWGTSRYDPTPSRKVVIRGNVIREVGRPIVLNGVQDGWIGGNFFAGEKHSSQVVLQRTSGVEIAPGSNSHAP